MAGMFGMSFTKAETLVQEITADGKVRDIVTERKKTQAEIKEDAIRSLPEFRKDRGDSALSVQLGKNTDAMQEEKEKEKERMPGTMAEDEVEHYQMLEDEERAKKRQRNSEDMEAVADFEMEKKRLLQVGDEAPGKDIITKIVELRNSGKVKSNDVFIFYYSGHIVRADGMLKFCTKGPWLSHRNVLAAMATLGVKRTIYIIDACDCGKVIPTKGEPFARSACSFDGADIMDFFQGGITGNLVLTPLFARQMTPGRAAFSYIMVKAAQHLIQKQKILRASFKFTRQKSALCLIQGHCHIKTSRKFTVRIGMNHIIFLL